MNDQQKMHSMDLTDLLYRKASSRLVPISGTFELSPVCNFDCRMCYVRKTAKEVRESERPILTLDDWRRIAREARDEGMLYLLLTGGEPFLWPDFWTLYDELIEMGFLISINTNGSLINEEAIARLKRRPPRRINITLYGACDETYERLCGVRGVFDRVRRAINALADAGIVVKLNCSLTPENVSDIDQIVAYAEARKLPLSTATYMFPPIRRDPTKVGINERFTPEEAAKHRLDVYLRQNGPEFYRTYLQNILAGSVEPPGLDEGCYDPIDGKIRCRAGKATFWVTWDGWVTPCGMMPEPKVDLAAQPFGDAWRALTEASGALRLSGVCDKCPNAKICNPCAAMAFAETGNSTGIPKYLCRVAKEMQAIARRTLDENK